MEGNKDLLEIRMARLEPLLLLVRRLVGWSASAFGEKIGVSRQTINNLETGRTHLSKTEYLLIRRVLDDEQDPAATEPSMLDILLKMLVDQPEDYSDEEREEVLSKTQFAVRTVIAKPEERKSLSKTWKSIIVAGGILTGATIAMILGKKK